MQSEEVLIKTEECHQPIISDQEYANEENSQNEQKFLGLNLLTEGIERLERQDPPEPGPDRQDEEDTRILRQDTSTSNIRHNSCDSSFGLLCDIAQSRIQEMKQPEDTRSDNIGNNRISRSRSLDDDRILDKNGNISKHNNRNFRSPSSESDIKNFIATKVSKSHGNKRGSNLASSVNRKNMEDWEVKMRISLAEIQ